MNIKTIQLLNIGIILILGLTLGCQNIGHRNFDNYKKEISHRYASNETSYPENYDSLCIQESQNNITFPRITPSYAVLHFDKLFKSDIRLTSEQMDNIIVILNDPTSYTWGELGTPYFDRAVTFYDNKGNCIGLTKIDFGGQTYSTPYNAKMKWGAMIKDDLFTLIRKIEKNKK